VPALGRDLRDRLGLEIENLLIVGDGVEMLERFVVPVFLAGFHVGIGSEVGEKAETSVASNDLQMIQRPLERSWLERVRISKNSAPMTGPYTLAPISEEDFKRLEKCSQFQEPS